MEMSVTRLSADLAAAGRRVAVFCRPDSAIERDARERRLDTVPFAPADYISPRSARLLRRQLNLFDVRIVHSHYSKDLWILCPALIGNAAVPLILTKHVGTRRAKTDALHRLIYSRVDRILAISSVIERNVRATHPIDPERVTLLHHGIAIDDFTRDSERRRRIREEFGLGNDQLLIGIVGRLQEGKGHLEFLHMAAKIAVRWPRTRFLVVGAPTRGEADRARPIYRLAARLELGQRVIFTGYRSDVPGILSALDIFAFPSHAEAFGLAVIEAMAAGVPVIASRCDGVLDIVRDGETGLLVEPRDAAQLTGAVDRLLRDEGLRARLGHEGRLSIERQFNKEKMIDSLLSTYAASLRSRVRD